MITNPEIGKPPTGDLVIGDLLTIHPDGRVEGRVEDMGEAAAAFVNALRVLLGGQWGLSATDHVVIPRPHVPFGPQGVPELVADATYLEHAAENLECYFEVGGSNVRATVVRLLREVAAALRSAHLAEAPNHTDGSGDE